MIKHLKYPESFIYEYIDEGKVINAILNLYGNMTCPQKTNECPSTRINGTT